MTDLSWQSRQAWLRERIRDMIDCLQQLESVDDWIAYKQLALEFSVEIQYCITEWDKYYPK